MFLGRGYGTRSCDKCKERIRLRGQLYQLFVPGPQEPFFLQQLNAMSSVDRALTLLAVARRI